ncbi:MAG TPA: tripartite tricarboxylate transporter substrate-binding protein [Candidatus Binatia bacterium]|nr:tripartite tricarboxylate transporter substrate-binding protein [Candidatus Binatia bacterium]
MKKWAFWATFSFALTLLLYRADAGAQEFYKGKTITIIVGNSVGGAQDDWARFIAQHLGRHIPGNPSILVQNMPGAGGIVAANHVYNIAKPDGLTIGMVNPAIYTDQLLGAKEVRFDWTKFGWIGSPERIDQVLFMRTDTPYKTLEDIRRAPEPPRCASLARSGLGYFLPRLMEEGLGIKFQIVVGYGGGGEMNLAIEKGEAVCRAGTVSAYVSREPTRTWIKNGFVRALVQSGTKRFSKLPDVPTLYELYDQHKVPDATKRVARVMLSSGDLGRPLMVPPATPAERVRILRDAFAKSMNDPALLAEAKKRNWDIDLLNGDELETMAKEIMHQPPDVIERVKKILGS